MKKIINDPELFEKEMLEGICAAYGDKVGLLDGNDKVLVSKYPVKDGKVGIATLGGSGPLPVFLGYVGQGLLDACAVGNVFASPSASTMADAIRYADHGSGVLCLYGNYGGDKLNTAMACEEVDFDDIETAAVIVADDICSSPEETKNERRGVAGMVYAFKVAGAAAENGEDLETVAAVAKKALENIRTMGVALTPCIVPRAGEPSFSIADDEIEIGMGIHGEPGIEVRKMMTADEIAETLFTTINKELQLSEGDECSVMINGLGGTPLEEQFIVYRKVAQQDRHAAHRRVRHLHGDGRHVPHRLQARRRAQGPARAAGSEPVLHEHQQVRGLVPHLVAPRNAARFSSNAPLT